MTVVEAMQEMFGLTPKQAEVLAYIVRYRHEHGYSPTYRKMAAHRGSKHVNCVTASVQALMAKGALRRIPEHKAARALVPCCELLPVKEIA